MSKRDTIRLSLNRETVRELTEDRLTLALGGRTPTLPLNDCSLLCSASSCCPGVGCNSAQSQCGAGC